MAILMKGWILLLVELHQEGSASEACAAGLLPWPLPDRRAMIMWPPINSVTKGSHKKSVFILDIVQKWPRPPPPHFGHL